MNHSNNSSKYFGKDIEFRNADCLKELPNIVDGSIDTIYLDPPFDSNRIYKLSSESDVGFNDKWKEEEYEHFIQEVLDLCFLKLKPTGTLFFHISAEKMFVPQKLLREKFTIIQPIFWKRCRSKNNVTSKLGATIDIIFKCNKSKKTKFRSVQQAKDEKYLANSYNHSDEERGNYALGHLVTEPSKKGYMYDYEFNGILYQPKSGWRIKKEELDILKAENRLHIPKTKNSKLYKKIYLSENPGKPCTDLWDDIHSIAQGNELRKYPTAKPVGLLERIIQLSTDEGDLVLDPMCGSGTTGEACAKLNRKCILMDKNEEVKPILEARFASL
jgi:DNA modification methylase